MNATFELTSAAKVLAQLRGRNAVKDAIRRHGLKVKDYKAREITSWAELFVEEHPALREQALADAKKMILNGLLGKRAAKALRANLLTHEQKQIEPISMGSAVQMSGAK